jgi:hypothetical protein
VLIPIPNPERDSTDPANYHPISLTSYLCKTFDRMVNNPLYGIKKFKAACFEMNQIFQENQT